MAVVAHTVGASTIGCMKELELDTRFSKTGWRAMLIKDNNGDIGILVAAWIGSSTIGTCNFLYYDLRSKESTVFNMPDKEGNYSVNLNGCKVDLTKGLFTLSPDKQQKEGMLDKICLGFAVSTLYLLVQPCPDNLELIQQKWKERKSTKAEKPHFLLNNEIKLLVLCGFLQRMYMPSNKNLAEMASKQGGTSSSRHLQSANIILVHPKCAIIYGAHKSSISPILQ